LSFHSRARPAINVDLGGEFACGDPPAQLLGVPTGTRAYLLAGASIRRRTIIVEFRTVRHGSSSLAPRERGWLCNHAVDIDIA
jgi:hypothetical protein